MADPADNDKTIWVPCNECRTRTRHEVLFQLDDVESTADEEYTWRVRYLVLRCLGCRDVTLCLDQWDAPWIDNDSVEDSQYSFYPPRVARHVPSWVQDSRLWRACPDVDGLLWEVYRALSANSRRLAMMGARSLLDLVIQHKVGDQGSFESGLKELVRAGFASANGVNHLKAAVEAGHASVHRGHDPSPREINQAMDIVENIIHSAFILDGVSAELAKHIPPRPPKK